MNLLTQFLVAGPDGTEPGFLTSEFVASLVAVAVLLIGPHVGWFNLDALAQAQLVTVIIGIYTLARGIRKGFANPVPPLPVVPPAPVPPTG